MYTTKKLIIIKEKTVDKIKTINSREARHCFSQKYTLQYTIPLWT